MGQDTVDASGLMMHTGHAVRVTGAQALARAGLSEAQISSLARWGAAAVLKYIRKAPLAATHRFAARALAAWSADSPGPSQPPAAQPLKPLKSEGILSRQMFNFVPL